jgi:putative flippase GtrA
MYYAGKYALINFTGTPVEYITGTATAIAWITAVLVAFITNKFYVFESKSLTAKTVMKELAPFFLARLLSFFLDLAMMVIGVDFLKINEFIIKTFSNIFVLIFNYIASKLFIFKKG